MKTNNNPLFKGASGRLGNMFFRTYRGKTTLVNRPARRNRLSESQKTTISRFKTASHYAKSQMDLPDMKEMYESGITDKKCNAYMVAMSDYLNAPVVHYIDADEYKGMPGDIIIVKATDDFMVTGVKVSVIGEDGIRLEVGNASPDLKRPDIWRYKTTTANLSTAGTIIRATALDMPGNTSVLEKVL